VNLKSYKNNTIAGRKIFSAFNLIQNPPISQHSCDIKINSLVLDQHRKFAVTIPPLQEILPFPHEHRCTEILFLLLAEQHI
jgi:hypothetical protein